MAFAIKNNSLARLLNKIGCTALHWISLNAVSLKRGVVLKRRNRFGRIITPVANRFLRWCRAPIRFWTELRAWQRWEVDCFRMLHPQFEAIPVGADAICQDQLPGVALWEHLRQGTLEVAMLEAAARELRRAHRHWSDVHQGGWSHGDAGMCNVLYEEETGRARLIDFDVMHERTLPTVSRQADDVMALLQDLAGYVPDEQWRPFALAYLRTYDDAEVMAELRRRLGRGVPRGAAWWWWKMRVNFAAEKKIARRFAQLARAMDQGALAGAERSDR